jgi:outer membrane protein assembly factor BamB
VPASAAALLVRRRRTLLAVVLALLLLVAGAVAALVVLRGNPGKGHLDTALKGVTVVQPAQPVHHKPKPKPKPHAKPKPAVVTDKPCWLNFGGDPQRTSSRLTLNLGLPVKPLWVRALHGYVEYPPSYCQGDLYVNTFTGRTYAINATTGKVLWMRTGQGPKPSTPAIAGDRVIVSSTSGTVTAFARSNGAKLWQLDLPGAKVESSPVVIGSTAYFGATDGRLFAVNTANGKVRWAYDTGGRINSSPSILGNKIFITTYAGSILSLNRFNGQRNWITYIRRDFAQYESFYASASTDGKRLYTISRAGKVVAVRVSDGSVVWTHDLNTTGYSTPAIANGVIYVGDFNGLVHAYRAADGTQLWQTYVGGRILAPGVIVGPLVFFSNLETKTFGLNRSNGKVVWHVGMGKYQPGIATDRHYYFTLNGLLVAYQGSDLLKKAAVKKKAAGASASTRASAAKHGSKRSKR